MASRSRSPARDARAHIDAEKSPVPARALDIDAPRGPKSRTATPPVVFKVGLGAQGHPGAGHPNGHAYKESPGHSRGHTPAAYDSEAMDTDVPVYDDTSVSKSKGKAGKQSKIEEKNVEDDEDIIVEEDHSMAAMQAMLGFGGFGTTKQKKVVGNDVYAVRKEKKTEYRQYMNRVGGFNRPLSPSRD
jgi:U4/U6.U5 tri-snRNP-associated protein 3